MFLMEEDIFESYCCEWLITVDAYWDVFYYYFQKHLNFFYSTPKMGDTTNIK